MALVGLATGSAVWLLLNSAGPSYEGRSVHDWMFETQSMELDKNPGLREIGSEAVPHLADALGTEETPYDRFALVRHPGVQSVLTNLTLRPGWTHSGIEIRYAALRSLLAFGSQAEPARAQLYAELTRSETSPEYQRLVLACLSRIGFGSNPTTFPSHSESQSVLKAVLPDELLAEACEASPEHPRSEL